MSTNEDSTPVIEVVIDHLQLSAPAGQDCGDHVDDVAQQLAELEGQEILDWGIAYDKDTQAVTVTMTLCGSSLDEAESFAIAVLRTAIKAAGGSHAPGPGSTLNLDGAVQQVRRLSAA